MRISDWSSDVCSSDLHVMLRCSKTARPAAVRRTGVDTGTECGAILQQIAAVRGAVNGLMVEVLEGHLRGHLAPLQSGDDGALDDVIPVLRSYLKRWEERRGGKEWVRKWKTRWSA